MRTEDEPGTGQYMRPSSPLSYRYLLFDILLVTVTETPSSLWLVAPVEGEEEGGESECLTILCRCIDCVQYSMQLVTRSGA
jgi:hypothetical protein